MNRRAFLRTLGTGAAAAAAAVSYPGKPTKAAVRIRWRMVMTWPLHSPVLGESMDLLAADVAAMSRGRFTLKLFGGGELVPPLGVFDAVSAGSVQIGSSAAYYWAGKIPAATFFTTVPFGMNAQQTNGWLYGGGGLDLWREVYEPHGLWVFPVGNSGVQMGGWFRKELRGLADIRGLKIRMPGLGGKVFSKAGGTVVLFAPSEIFPALERGVIDAAEWVGPYLDLRMGLHQAAKYYYYPGWQEPSAVVELSVNLKAWKALPAEFQAMLETAAGRANQWALSEFEARNAKALRELVEKKGVKLRRFPDDMLRAFGKASREVIEDLAAREPTARKVYDLLRKYFRTQYD
ncbi:MAG: TRAP transporter substrate-binding protein, partial [Nitrospinota bacterium]